MMRKTVFRNGRMTFKTKKVVFVCLVIMVCLYGCESWAITEEIKRMLRKLQYRCLRDMMKVSKAKQIQDKVSRIQLLKALGMEDILYYMRYLQLNWLGKMRRMETHRLPRRLLASWLFECRS